MGIHRLLLAVDMPTVMHARGLHHRVRSLITIRSREDPAVLRLDVAWHAIHFLLNGDRTRGQQPWCWIVFGGELLCENAPRHARFLTTLQVQRVAAVLAEVDQAQLRERFDPEVMATNSIYPGTAAVPDFWFRPDVIDWFLSKYAELRAFYAAAAASGSCVVQWRLD